MIAAIRGRIFTIQPGELDIDTGSGLILHVYCPVSSYSQLKDREEVTLHTVMRQKDDESVLYGFLTPREKLFFTKLIAISGVGGKTALSFMSTFSLSELAAAIEDGDLNKLSAIPGIGKKTAQRIILELTGKMKLPEENGGIESRLKDELISGLIHLGYPQRSAAQCVAEVLKEGPQQAPFEDLFKKALKRLSQR